MAISTSLFTLVSKKALTHDVWELDFVASPKLPVITSDTILNTSLEEAPKILYKLDVIPGQYILFLLPSGLRRAYSIAYSFISLNTEIKTLTSESSKQIFRFVIKRLPHGGAGSQEVCDLEVGESLQGMWPMGHFMLDPASKNTLFIGTGTGFAPLYYQIRAQSVRENPPKMHFAFGVRSEIDAFYHEEIMSTGVSFTQYYSAPAGEAGEKGYVTAYLTPENISGYEQFSICGSPAMVKSAREILEAAGVAKDAVKFEQY